MKVSELLTEEPILGRGMSKAARAADIEQSDREYIAARQAREKKWKAERLQGCKCKGPLRRDVSKDCPIHGIQD